MAELESYKKELIEKISEQIDSNYHLFKCFDVDNKINSYEEYYAFMNKMTFDEICVFVNGRFRDKMMKLWNELRVNKDISIINIKIKEVRTYVSVVELRKEIAVIKDNVQNTADIVNLFTDIDKNRTSLEEQIKKVNNRLDEQDTKINNRMEKLEASIELIVGMLQKS